MFQFCSFFFSTPYCTEVVAIKVKGVWPIKWQKQLFCSRKCIFLLMFCSNQKNCKRTKYNTAITYKSSPFCTFYTVLTLDRWFSPVFSAFILFSQKGKMFFLQMVWAKLTRSKPGGPPAALRQPLIAAPSSRLCWPGNCGCCELPCTA